MNAETIKHELSQFPLGRHLLEARSLDGFWTDYVVHLNTQSAAEPMEKRLLSLPTVRATQERGRHFVTELQRLVSAAEEQVAILSAPCGLMRDVLELNYGGVRPTLHGLDIDPKSLQLAAQLAEERGIDPSCLVLEQQDIWSWEPEPRFDIVTSNGLNVYFEDSKVRDLYRTFYKALKPGGVLVTSFLTPPPLLSSDSPWCLDEIDYEDLALQKLIFVDVLDAAWQNYRSERESCEQLESVGFVEVTLRWDKARIFPTLMARKPTS